MASAAVNGLLNIFDENDNKEEKKISQDKTADKPEEKEQTQRQFPIDADIFPTENDSLPQRDTSDYWVKVKNKNSTRADDKYYYWNTVTNQTRWDNPWTDDPQKQSQAQARYPTYDANKYNYYAHSARAQRPSYSYTATAYANQRRARDYYRYYKYPQSKPSKRSYDAYYWNTNGTQTQSKYDTPPQAPARTRGSRSRRQYVDDYYAQYYGQRAVQKGSKRGDRDRGKRRDYYEYYYDYGQKPSYKSRAYNKKPSYDGRATKRKKIQSEALCSIYENEGKCPYGEKCEWLHFDKVTGEYLATLHGQSPAAAVAAVAGKAMEPRPPPRAAAQSGKVQNDDSPNMFEVDPNKKAEIIKGDIMVPRVEKEEKKQVEVKEVSAQDLKDKFLSLMEEKIERKIDAEPVKSAVVSETKSIKLNFKEHKLESGSGRIKIFDQYNVQNVCWEFNTFEGCRKGGKCNWSHHYLLKETYHPYTGVMLNGMAVRKWRINNNMNPNNM